MKNEVAGLENFQLDPYQLEGVEFILSRLSGEVKVNGVASAGCILADPAGMGKKRQALAAVHCLMTRPLNPVKKVVIVCHGDVVAAWKNEVLQVFDSASRAVVVIDTNSSSQTVEQAINVFVYCGPRILVLSTEDFVSRAGFIGTYIDVLVCDNISQLTQSNSPIAKAVRGLRADAKRLLLVSAPPSSLMLDLIHMTNPKMGCGKPPSRSRVGANKNNKKTGSCSKLILRRENSAVFDGFPSKTTVIAFLSPSPIQRSILRDIVGRGGREPSKDLQEMKKVCCHPRLAEGVRDELRFGTEAPSISSPKFEALREILQLASTQSECVVVIVRYAGIFELLAESLSVQGVVVHVAVEAATIASSILQFNLTPGGHSAVLLTFPEVAGRFSLTRANRVVFLEYEINPEKAVSSIWRVGQARECFVYQLVLAGTVEERILQAHACKARGWAREPSFSTYTLVSDAFLCDTHENFLACGCGESPQAPADRFALESLSTWAHTDAPCFGLKHVGIVMHCTV